MALQEDVEDVGEDDKPLARLSVTLPIGLQVQAFARIESAQAELATPEAPSGTRVKLLQAAAAEDAQPTPRRRLSPLGAICGGNRNNLLSRLTRSRDSSRDSAPEEGAAPEAAAPKQGGSTRTLGSFRSNTREFAVGVATGIVSHLKLSCTKIAMPYHVWVHKETDSNPNPSPNPNPKPSPNP